MAADKIEIKDEYRWNLEDIYPSDEDWEKDFNRVNELLPGYRKFIGKLGSSVETLLSCFKFDDELGIKLERLSLYAMLAKDSDMRVPKYQAMEDRIKSSLLQGSAASSFIKPELLEIPDENCYPLIRSDRRA